MLETVGKYTIMLIIACSLSILAYWTKSDYLKSFFANNAILLAITVFTIHAAGAGILMSQLDILKIKTNKNFSSIIKEIRKSFIESFIWLSIITICAISLESINIEESPIYNISYIEYILTISLVLSVIALLYIVYDTVNAILICLEL